jgi:8-oxo-dGTP pyrophosphatase MutT (NUDIX family)
MSRSVTRPLGNAYADPMALPVDLRRMFYRVAYFGLRIYWLLFRPHVNGVKCVLTDGDHVLLVRHTYGPRGWDLPGGSPKRGEKPVQAARREMEEELGVSIEQWRLIGQLELIIDHRRDCLYCFQAELHTPKLEVDRGELAAVRWFPQRELPPDLGRYTRQILARAAISEN